MVELEDALPKWLKHSIAELSWPHRAETQRTCQKRKETQKKG
jgi:hypothetical protein